MTTRTLQELIPVLQVAIGPVILISGVGLLLLSMTNRYGRVIDRAWQLAREQREGVGDLRQLGEQLAILWRRARIVQAAITLAAASVLLAAFVIVGLFFAEWTGTGSVLLIVLLFTGCLGSLVASLAAFLYDIHVSLQALHLEIGESRHPPSSGGDAAAAPRP